METLRCHTNKKNLSNDNKKGEFIEACVMNISAMFQLLRRCFLNIFHKFSLSVGVTNKIARTGQKIKHLVEYSREISVNFLSKYLQRDSN